MRFRKARQDSENAQRTAPKKPSRIKTYAAQTGFVYQYYFAGEQHVGDTRRYEFQVSSNRAAYLPLVVELPGDVVKRWQRGLSPTECYAVAKMSLFETFDSEQFRLSRGDALSVSDASLNAIASALDLI